MTQAHPVAGRSMLWLIVNRIPYALTKLDPHPDSATIAWQMKKTDGTEYTVHQDSRGHQHCTCADFVWRREHRDGDGCKHVSALRCVGLLPQLEQP